VVYLLAHHDGHFWDAVDIFGLRPESTLDHMLAFGAYGLFASAIVGAGPVARGQIRRAGRPTPPRRGEAPRAS
jgi:hypothetical protein